MLHWVCAKGKTREINCLTFFSYLVWSAKLFHQRKHLIRICMVHLHFVMDESAWNQMNPNYLFPYKFFFKNFADEIVWQTRYMISCQTIDFTRVPLWHTPIYTKLFHYKEIQNPHISWTEWIRMPTIICHKKWREENLGVLKLKIINTRCQLHTLPPFHRLHHWHIYIIQLLRIIMMTIYWDNIGCLSMSLNDFNEADQCWNPRTMHLVSHLIFNIFRYCF